jgi:2'-5' RNA ligase
MRLFLAVELSDKTKKEIDDQLSEIKKVYPQFQWVPSENYHITVNFFGEVTDPKKLIDRLEQIMFDKNSFYFYSNSVDLFIHNKITIVLHFRREKEIEKINESVRETFQKFESSLKFVPHLTLARYKIPSKQQYFVIKKRLSRMSVDISFKVNKLVLFNSILGQNKPVYKKIHTFKLL